MRRDRGDGLTAWERIRGTIALPLVLAYIAVRYLIQGLQGAIKKGLHEISSRLGLGPSSRFVSYEPSRMPSVKELPGRSLPEPRLTLPTNRRTPGIDRELG